MDGGSDERNERYRSPCVSQGKCLADNKTNGIVCCESLLMARSLRFRERVETNQKHLLAEKASEGSLKKDAAVLF